MRKPHPHVTAVLLADGWHTVAQATFSLLTDDGDPWAGTQDADSIWSWGFTFTDDNGDQITGPIASIQAIRETDTTATATTEPQPVCKCPATACRCRHSAATMTAPTSHSGRDTEGH